MDYLQLRYLNLLMFGDDFSINVFRLLVSTLKWGYEADLKILARRQRHLQFGFTDFHNDFDSDLIIFPYYIVT